MWTHTKESQDKITPQLALQYLKEGNLRFLGNLKAQRNLLKQVNATSEGQFPFATILSCIDSRTSAELIFDQGLGDIFSIRIAGNILNNDILGSMEYACSIANSKVVVVLGHTKCGAIIGACNSIMLGHIAGITKKIEQAILREVTIVDDRTGSNMEFVNRVSIQNVMLTISQVRAQSPVLKDLEQQGKILIVGGIYNIDTGEVTFIDGV